MWDTARLAMGMSFLATLLVDQATLADGRVIDRCSAWCSSIGVPYFRFSPQLSEDISMDEKNDEKLVNMLWETKAYMFNQEPVVKKLSHLLKSKFNVTENFFLFCQFLNKFYDDYYTHATNYAC